MTAATELVTVLIGGNDVGTISTLLGLSCQDEAAAAGQAAKSCQDEAAAAGQAAKCSVASQGTVDDGLAALPDRLAQVFAAIRARAPKARIVLVDYMRAVSGSCADRAPLTAANQAQAFQLHARLTRAMAGAARANGVDLLPAAALSAGYGVCSTRPWVFAYSPPPAADPSFPTPSTIRTPAPWG